MLGGFGNLPSKAVRWVGEKRDGAIRRAHTAIRTLPFLRRRDRAAALKALARADSVLFLCYGNICRSPFAERYARKVLPSSVAVRSAGVFPREGRRSPTEARAAASRVDVSLEDHRSQLVTPEMMDEADVIFVFDVWNYMCVPTEPRRWRKKTSFVGNLDLSGPMIVADPWGGSEEGFDETYRTIRACLDAAVESGSS